MDCLNDSKEAGIIYGVGTWEKGEIKTSKEMENAYEVGKRII